MKPKHLIHFDHSDRATRCLVARSTSVISSVVRNLSYVCSGVLRRHQKFSGPPPAQTFWQVILRVRLGLAQPEHPLLAKHSWNWSSRH